MICYSCFSWSLNFIVCINSNFLNTYFFATFIIYYYSYFFPFIIYIFYFKLLFKISIYFFYLILYVCCYYLPLIIICNHQSFFVSLFIYNILYNLLECKLIYFCRSYCVAHHFSIFKFLSTYYWIFLFWFSIKISQALLIKQIF